MSGWENNMNYTYNGILALKRKKIPSHATAWMNPKDIMPDEISQSQTNLVWVHLHEISRDVKIIETESKIEAVRGWEGGGGGGGGDEVSSELQFCKMKSILKVNGGDGCITIWNVLKTTGHTVKNGYDGKFHGTFILPQ